ncbi:unnamed protein product, partial [Choristocarpus tenellus]
QGTLSLIRRTLYSSVDTTNRIASSVSFGLLASGTVDILIQGGRLVRPYGILDGFMLGMAGAVREPLLGLHGSGLAGLARGALTGWLGLAIRPMYGALMSTSQVCRMASVYLDPRLDSKQKLGMLRARPPRFFQSRDQVLSVYSQEENIGEEVLSRVHGGRYRSDGYVWHTPLQARGAFTLLAAKEALHTYTTAPTDTDMMVLVTGRRLLMLHGRVKNRSGRPGLNYCVVEWEVEFGLMVALKL